MELPKRYDAQEEEPKLQALWRKERLFAFDEKSDRPVFSIDTPPPYASADHLHVGHGMHYSQFEFVARYKRMRGFNVFFPMGFDDNGLPTERYVERKHKVDKRSINRADFIKLCLEETRKTGKTYEELFDSLGFSIDWSLLYQTIDKRSQRVSQASFIELHKKGHLRHEDLPTTWCVKCQTTIAQADLENVERKSTFNDVAFSVDGKEAIISTTRPELIPACVALAAHPDDKRYSKLKGKRAKVPLMDYDAPLIFDESVDMEKGTGLMMVCTFGDKEDIEKWHVHDLDLRIIFTEDGRLNELAGPYKGLRIKEARERIIADLEQKGFLKGSRPIVHAVNVHERCGTEIEFLKKKQWSVVVLDNKDALINAGRAIDWHPAHMRVRYEHWVKNLQWDWVISRQRYYGVPFPVWYCKKCGAVKLPAIDDLPVDPRDGMPKTPCECGSDSFEPEMDVMDTWMTSSVSPQINAHWTLPDERKGFLPMSLRPQAHDIIRTWAFYTIVKSHYLTGQKPWNDVMISGHGQDPHGQKMSKSKGNFVVAQDVIKKYSADAFRFWAASTKLGEDLPYQEKDIVTGQKTVTKLWNAARFSLMHLASYDGNVPEAELELFDKWILTKFAKLVEDATESFDRYEYSRTKSETENFFWNVFTADYLELIKDRLYNPSERGPEAHLSAQFALYEVLLGILKLFAPIMPHVTDHIYRLGFSERDGHKSIHVTDWPEVREEFLDAEAHQAGDILVGFLSEVRKYKSENQLSMRAEIDHATIVLPKHLRERAEAGLRDFQATARITDISFEEGEPAIRIG